MNFIDIRQDILKCRLCIDNIDCKHKLIFNNTDTNKVKIIIISEQPKLNKTDLCSDEMLHEVIKNSSITGKNKISTRDEIYKMFPGLEDSIREENGKYYWTHYTKCASIISKPQKRCALTWIKKEIECFKEAKCIIVFGAKAYSIINNIFRIGLKYDEYIWEIIKNTVLAKDYSQFRHNGILIFVLPHPSKRNGFSIILPKLIPYVIGGINESI
jgi:uracil-DNA glycosylase